MNIPTGTLLTLSRLSPLHHKHSSLLDPEILKDHAHRLSEAIREEDLIDCVWRPWTLSRITTEKVEASDVNVNIEDATGVSIEIVFAKGAPCTALLLGSGTIFEERESYLPLLMTRMHASIRQLLVRYLEGAFDCRVGRWIFQPRDLESALKKWIAHYPENTEDQQTETRNVVATLAFTSSLVKGLQTFDITIAYTDIALFVVSGKEYLKMRRHGWRGPFVASLGLGEELAVDRAYEACVVYKIKYVGLTLGIDGKVRFPDGDREKDIQARTELMEMLLQRAGGLMSIERRTWKE